MVIENRDGYLERIKEIVGDRVDDIAIKFVEDMSDTYDNITQNSNILDANDITREAVDKVVAEWDEKYKALDNEWRTRYKERFFDGVDSSTTVITEKENIESPETYDDLFN